MTKMRASKVDVGMKLKHDGRYLPVCALRHVNWQSAGGGTITFQLRAREGFIETEPVGPKDNVEAHR